MRGYYETYFSKLQERMSRYPAMSEIFPDVLLGTRHSVVELAVDGVVALHWPAQRSGFEFHLSPHRLVRDITGDHYLSVPSGRSASFFQYETGSDFGAYTLWRPELIEGSAVATPRWASMDIASLDSLDSVLAETQASEYAENDVQVAADAYLMGLAPAPPGKEQQDKAIAGLEAAINEFEKVLETHANDEKMIQLFLDTKRNRILLEPGMIPPLRSEVWIGRNKADFVVELPPGERYLLVEIERPIHKLFTEKDRITKEVNHAQQQVEDWMNRISEHPHEARETLPGIREPQGWVVIGRRSIMTENQQRVLERKNARMQNITIMTYDDLLDRAKQHLENLRPLEP